MDTSEFKPEIRMLSQSPFHQYMTKGQMSPDSPKSSFNPYRKKVGIFTFLGLDAIEKALAEPAKESQRQSNQALSTSSILTGLEPLR